MERKSVYFKITTCLATCVTILLLLASASSAIEFQSPSPMSNSRLRANKNITFTFNAGSKWDDVRAILSYDSICKPSNPNWIEFGRSASFNTSGKVADRYTVTGLLPNISLSNTEIRIKLINKNGVEIPDTADTIINIIIDNTNPTNPTFAGLPASGAWHKSAGSITFNWSQSQVGTDPIQNYYIYRTTVNSLPTPGTGYLVNVPVTNTTNGASIGGSYAATPGEGYNYYWVVTEDTSLSDDSPIDGNANKNMFFSYFLDTQPPTVTVPASKFVKTPSFTVNWSGSDALSGISYWSYEVQSGGNWTACSNSYTGATDGTTYLFHAMATDNAGNSSSWSSSTSVTVDMTPPGSKITSVAGLKNGTVESVSPTIYWGPDGSDFSGIQSYSIECSESPSGPWTPFGTYNSSITHAIFNSTGNPNVNGHTYYIRSQATDRAGNVEDAHSNPDVSFKIVAGDSPTNLRMNPNVYDDPTPTFEWGSPVESASTGYIVSFESGYFANITPVSEPATYTYTTPASQAFSDGWHTIYVRSKNSQNVWTETPLDFKIDTTSPALSGITVIQNGASPTIIGSASDAVEVDKVQYQIVNAANNNSTVWFDFPGTFGDTLAAFSQTETNMADGTYIFKVRAIDGVNHVSEVFTTGLVTIDASYPTIILDIGKNSFTEPSTDPVIVDADSPLKTTIKDGNGIDSATLTITGIDNDYYQEVPIVSNKDAALSSSYNAGLGDGKYMIDIVASSEGKISELFVALQVYAGGVRVLGEPYTYPNPFKPGLSNVIFRYELTRDSDVKFLVYTMTGKPVKAYAFSKGLDGGKAGINTPTWDGKDNFEHIVANGPYYYFVIVDGKVIGRGEMCAFQ